MAAEVPTEAVVRASLDRRQAESYSLVLEAMAIPHRVVPTDAGFALTVPPRMVASAIAALDAQEREVAEGPLREAPVPDHGPSFVGVAMVVTITAFFVVSGPRAGADVGGWFRLGSAMAQKIVRDHELWRAVTALCLHADAMHVAGNAVASLVFVTALGRWLGPGVALLATLLAGVAGNLLTAFLYATTHNSVGASTSTFGALGVLGGLQFVRRFRDASVGRFRRALLGIAAALGLLAMLGMGERSDVVAHATGLGFGVLAGVGLGLLVKRPVRGLGQALCLLATVCLLCGAWLLAFWGHR
ncbi:MAG: rhomboid family intramembrane serine protease [Deltaproteobacteria bacterium]|nr:rhomboid family intramembrane serine protease [Deltaproteobacteria bacterium]